jgi:hypothetical protein
MRQNLGVWIDRREAVLVRLDEGEESIERIESRVNGRGSPSRAPRGPQDSANEGRRDRRRAEERTRF